MQSETSNRSRIHVSSYLPFLLQIGRTQPALSSWVRFGGFGFHQPSVRVNRVQDLHKLPLLQNKTVLVPSSGAAVGSSHVDFKDLQNK